MPGVRAGLVGVGPVGDAIVTVLKEHNFPLAEPLRVMATSCRTEVLCDEEFVVQETCETALQGLDVVFFAGREGGKGASVQWGHCALEAGAWCIDNGSDFRMDPSVPLVVPEVNMSAVTRETRLIANPNCSTIQMVVALAPLHRVARIKRIVVSTYQAVSGWGKAAMEELESQVAQVAAGGPVEFDPAIFPRPIALDCLPHIDRFTPSGYTKEELKMVNETRKILGVPDLPVTATTVRVPVMIGHAESVNVEFEKEISAERAREILSDPEQSPGVVVIDGPTHDPNAAALRKAPEELQYPTQADVLKPGWRDSVLVGRIRQDETVHSGLNLWVVSDNLRKGAATNAVQIAEKLIERGMLGK
jgi:aspartate-semialdehyde dehydrogenase